MTSDFNSISVLIEESRASEDVFGQVSGNLEEKRRAVNALYRKMSLVIHPDRFQSSPSADRAKTVFVRLAQWKEEAERRLDAGIYGNTALGLPTKVAPLDPQTISTPKGVHEISALFRQGDLADLYLSRYTPKSGKSEEVLFKVAQSPADNDLLEVESRVLGAMYPTATPEEKFYRYLPKLYDSFQLKGNSGSIRRVNILQKAEGYFSLAEVITAYPKGLDYRDVVWMFKRLLAGLGYVHKKKDVVHGAVLPTHVVVHPTEHGAKLIDWCYSVSEWKSKKSRVRAISAPYKSFYAPEVLNKKSPTPQTDLYMAAKCAIALLGGNVETNQVPSSVPKEIQAFLGSCLLLAQNKRPDDAWALHEDFDALLLRLVGKSKYRPLKMPSV